MDQFYKDRIEIAVMVNELTGVELVNRIEDLCAAHYLRGYTDATVSIQWEATGTES